jgi:radical SAM superfamily enzyme YgiQ (UPF0313 family)
MANIYREKLKILFINAIDPNSEVESRYPNLGLGYLSASLRREIPDVDFDFLIIDDDVKNNIATFKPDLAAITTVSQNFPIALNYMDLLSEFNIPTIWGGVHISALPHLLPHKAVLGCIGEGEQTVVDIVNEFIKDGLTAKSLASIPGIVYWDDGELKTTTSRESISNLDDLPMPARDLLDIGTTTYMFTSRGCPYRCTFCSSSRYWGKTRFFSAEYVVNEIEFLHREYNVSMIRFFDDLFIAKRSRLKEILEMLEMRNLLGKIKFTCNCRANRIDDDLADLLKKLGVVSVGFGLESADEKTLKYLKGDNVSIEQNREAVEIVKKKGIAANASFIIGSPDEGRESIMRTYDFIRSSKLDAFEIYVLTPFPGTPVWDYAKQRGLVNEENFDWATLSVNLYRDPDRAIVLSEILSKDEIISYYRKFKRLRLLRNFKNIWKHPLRSQLPRYLLKRAKEFYVDRLRR